MLHHLKVFAVTMVIFLILDFTWLSVIAKKLYASQYGALMRQDALGNLDPNIGAAVIVYVLLVIGIMIFVVPKAQGSMLYALLWGGFYGMVTYGIYDFTNMAVLANWPIPISFIDWAWGTVLCGSTSLAAAYFDKLFS